MKLCSVSWCAALATHGDFCAIHWRDRNIHPAYLAADEEMADEDEGAECEECRGTGDCENCYGMGECECECRTCGSNSHACGICDGDGNCKRCRGTGKVEYRKKPTPAKEVRP